MWFSPADWWLFVIVNVTHLGRGSFSIFASIRVACVTFSWLLLDGRRHRPLCSSSSTGQVVVGCTAQQVLSDCSGLKIDKETVPILYFLPGCCFLSPPRFRETKLETPPLHCEEWRYPVMAQETPLSRGPVLTGVCQVTEKMEQRTCALCPEGHDWSVIYFVQSANIAVHENCLVSYWYITLKLPM